MGVGGVCVVSDTAVYNAPNVNAGGGFMFFGLHAPLMFSYPEFLNSP